MSEPTSNLAHGEDNGTTVRVWFPGIEDGDHPVVAALVDAARRIAEEEGADLSVRVEVGGEPVWGVTSLAPPAAPPAPG